MVEDDRGAMLRALADEDTLRVFAQVVTVTGTGLPQRSAGLNQLPLRQRPWGVAPNGAGGQRRPRRRAAVDRSRLDD